MTLDEAVRTAHEFLDGYMVQKNYFADRPVKDPDQLRMWVQYVATVPPAPDVIEVMFGVGGGDSPDEPEVQERGAEAIAALRAAHPELRGFDVQHTFYP